MATVIRRVLLLLVLLALAASWATRPQEVRAQQGADPSAVQPADPPSADDNASANAASALSIPSGGRIAIIEIEGPILFSHHLDSVQRRVDRALADGTDLIVFDLDTPGGALDIALEMSQLIRTAGVPTVAWVNNQALSAGILIGSACDELVMSKASLTGDCAPIIPGQNLAPTERAKALSPLLAEFRANAQDNYAGPSGSDYAVFHAMCVLGVEVYQVRHRTTGEVRLVSQADYAVMVDGASPLDAAQIGTPTNTSAVTGPDEMSQVGKPVITVATQADIGQWERIKQIHDGSTLLTVNELEALDAGLSRATISSDAALQQLYGGASTQRYDETWSESLVGLLVHPIVRACLLLVGIAGLLMEYFSPGLLVPGIVGVVALATLIGAPFLIGLAQTWHLALIVIGAGLVIYELFTMTTFGVLAIVGMLMFLAGLVLSGVQSAANGLPAPDSQRQILVTSMSFVGSIVLMVPVLIVMTRYFGSLPMLNRLVLNEHQDAINAEGAITKPHERVAGDESFGGGMIQPGMIGAVSATGLRPAGRVEIDDQLIDVTSTGGFIDPGTTVRVVEVHGNVIHVERAEAS